VAVAFQKLLIPNKNQKASDYRRSPF